MALDVGELDHMGDVADEFDLEAIIGVPVKARLLNNNGTAFTITAGPTPMSDRHVPIRLVSPWTATRATIPGK